MAILTSNISSDYTFDIPKLIKTITDYATMATSTGVTTFKRVSANGVLPVILEASSDLMLSLVLPFKSYIGYGLTYTTDPTDYKTFMVESVTPTVVTGLTQLIWDIDHYDSTSPKFKVIYSNTAANFTSILQIGTVVNISGEERIVVDVIDDNSFKIERLMPDKLMDLCFYTYVSKYTIQLLNNCKTLWNEFPLIDETNVYYTKENNIKFSLYDVTKYAVDFYYIVKGQRTEDLVLDLAYTSNVGNDGLTLELAVFKKEITKDMVRTGEIFFDSNYIDMAKDVDGDISKLIYTFANSIEGAKLRLSTGVNLTDQIVRFRIKLETEADEAGIKLDVRENSLGLRYNVADYKIY